MGRDISVRETIMTGILEIRNNHAENRFEIDLGGASAFITYAESAKFITYFHVEVPSEFEGKGIAKKLTVYALNYARERDLAVNALCPFVAAYVRRHPEYKDLLSEKSRREIFGG